MILRPYQNDAVQAITEKLVEHRSTICVAATGLGKTVILAAVAERFSPYGKVLVVAHRDELIRQNAETIEVFTGERCDIEMGSETAGSPFGLIAASRYISTTVQTQTSNRLCGMCLGESCEHCWKGKRYRFQKFDPKDFSLVVFDEGHHATASTWRKIKEWYGQNEECRFLLLTATPKRSDRVGLGNICESVSFRMGIVEAISGGWLVPIRGKYVHVEGLDISRVKKASTGDFKESELEKAMIGDGGPLNRVASAIAKEGRRAIVFTVGKEHSRRMADALRSVGMRAESITEDTPKEQRKEFKAQLISGHLDALTGVDVLTEGFDVKEIGLVACVRPTLSVSTLTQMIGRGTRPLAGVVDGPETPELRKDAIARSAKPDCLVLDFVGNSGRHKLASVFDVLGGDSLPSDVGKAIKRRVKDGKEFDVRDALEDERIAREKREAAALERKRVRSLAQNHDYVEREVDLFEDNYDIKPAQPATRSGGASDKQINYMLALGYSYHLAYGASSKKAGALIKQAVDNGVKPDFKKARIPIKQVPKPSPVSSGASMEEIFEALRQ
jgi:DNA repair protein RadD